MDNQSPTLMQNWRSATMRMLWRSVVRCLMGRTVHVHGAPVADESTPYLLFQDNLDSQKEQKYIDALKACGVDDHKALPAALPCASSLITKHSRSC